MAWVGHGTVYRDRAETSWEPWGRGILKKVLEEVAQVTRSWGKTDTVDGRVWNRQLIASLASFQAVSLPR